MMSLSIYAVWILRHYFCCFSPCQFQLIHINHVNKDLQHVNDHVLFRCCISSVKGLKLLLEHCKMTKGLLSWTEQWVSCSLSPQSASCWCWAWTHSSSCSWNGSSSWIDSSEHQLISHPNKVELILNQPRHQTAPLPGTILEVGPTSSDFHWCCSACRPQRGFDSLRVGGPCHLSNKRAGFIRRVLPVLLTFVCGSRDGR